MLYSSFSLSGFAWVGIERPNLTRTAKSASVGYSFVIFAPYDQVVRTEIEKSEVSICPLGASNKAGALAPLMLNTIDEAASNVKTATMVDSMLLKLPWLSRYGTTMMILKLAKHAMVDCALLLGTRYGSLGATITELARITGGGKLKVLQTPALARAVAIVVRSVVNATVMTHPTIVFGLRYGASKPLIDAIKVFDILNGLGT